MQRPLQAEAVRLDRRNGGLTPQKTYPLNGYFRLLRKPKKATRTLHCIMKPYAYNRSAPTSAIVGDATSPRPPRRRRAGRRG